jgi:single-strand DNA-binding protein
MSSFNKVIFMGHLTADPVAKTVGESALAQFTVAANRKSKRKDGTVIEDACFLDVEAWGQQSEIVTKYLNKGNSVLIEGRLRQANWQAKDGTNRSKILLVCENIVLLDQRDSSGRDQEPKTINKQACFDIGSVDKKIVKEADNNASNQDALEELPF